jgi:CRISPR-associated protein Cas2
MYVILFYDIADKSIRAKKENSYKIRKEVEKYLTRVQFSVFEGEITPSDLKKLKAHLRKVADGDLDSIIIYESTRMNYTERVVIGVDKNDGIFTC